MWFRLAVPIVLLASAAVHAQGPASSPAGTGVIRGVVTAADTGTPLRGADIRVAGSATSPGREPLWVRTDEQGHYRVTGLTPGRYTLTAQKVGYLTLGYGQRRPGESGRPIEVSETPTDEINFALPRGGVIVARVTDSFGDPVRGLIVRALEPRFVNGQRQLQQAPGLPLNVTDDRGEIRLFGLQPGEYYVATGPIDAGRLGRHDTVTFHPGTIHAEEAQPVRLGLGGEVSVTFPTVRLRPARLSGVILGSNGAPLASPRASIAQSGVGGSSSRLLIAGADGTFNEESLPAGDYAIEVREPEHAIHRVRLAGDDVTDVVITTRKPAAVRGLLRFEDDTVPGAPVQIRPAFVGAPIMPGLSAGAVRWSGGVGPIEVRAEDNWTFDAQIAGTGVLRVWPPSSPWLLRAVLLDGKDVTETALDFSSAYDGKPLEIVLTSRSSTVAGSVSDDRGELTSDCVVVIFPEDEAHWTTFSRLIATARPDQEGRFSLSGLPPGRYLIAALEYLAPGEERNPDTLAPLRGVATSLSLSEGESRAMSLRLTR